MIAGIRQRASIAVLLLSSFAVDTTTALVCPLCGDASVQPLAPDKYFPGGFSFQDSSIDDCAGLSAALAINDNPSITEPAQCDLSIGLFRAYCECPGIEPLVDFCSGGVCGATGGTPRAPNVDLVVLAAAGIDVSDIEEANATTCGELDFFLKYGNQLLADSVVAEDCTSVLESNVVPNICECDTAPPIQGTNEPCYPCGGPNFVLGTPDETPAFLQGVTCQLIYDAALGGSVPPARCSSFAGLGLICGGCKEVEQPDPTPVPTPVGSLAPGSEEPTPPPTPEATPPGQTPEPSASAGAAVASFIVFVMSTFLACGSAFFLG